MKTLLLSEVFPPQTGGSGRWFWEVYRRLSRQAYVVAAGTHPLQDRFDQSHDLSLFRLPLQLSSWGILGIRNLQGYWRAIRQVRALIHRERVTMIHCGRCLPEGLMALTLKWLCGTRYICYVHGEEVQYAASSRELGWLLRRVMAGAEFFIANSCNTRRILTDKWAVAPDRIRVLHPGVDASRFVPAALDREVRRALGWDPGPVLLTVGRLQTRKGHDRLIAALPRIRRIFPAVRYAIVGDGEERQKLERLAAELGVADAVQFLGEVDDSTMLTYYQQCDLFVLPNRQVGQDIEGFGIVLVEAQSCGKAVVAGTSGGTAETMRIPESGRLVDCEDGDRLAAVVIDLLSQPQLLAEIGAAGRAWAVSRFDWQALTQQAEEIFLGKTGDPAESTSMTSVATLDPLA